MTAADRRHLPANGRVAARFLEGQVAAERFTEGEAASIIQPVADLMDRPEGRRDRQLQFGASVTVFEQRAGWAFVQAQADGYVGYLQEAALGVPAAPTHRIRTRASHVYSEPDLKSPERLSLGLGAELRVLGEAGGFAETPEGFIPSGHLELADQRHTDPVAVAEILTGTPYLWGGNSAFGIDCSGLVQIACRFCGIACPGDSDLQQAAFSGRIADGAPRRGDLLFWKGHVAWVANADRILHANAMHMAVAFEGLEDAVARIRAQGDGDVTAHLRILPEE